MFQNVVLVGDAAYQINPLAGEGVRHTLAAGKLAAQVIYDSLKGGTANVRSLKRVYERKWRSKFARSWRICFLFSNIFYRLSDKDMDALIGALKEVTPEDIFEIMFHYRLTRFAKYPRVIGFLLKHGVSFLRVGKD